MNGVTQDLITQIAVALNSEDSPPVKDGVSYRIIVFKEKHVERWVVAMIPDIIMVEELFVVVNESYGLFLEGVETPNGIIFRCADEPHFLIELAKEWYFEASISGVTDF